MMSLNDKIEELLPEPIAYDYGLRHFVGDDAFYGQEQIVTIVDTILSQIFDIIDKQADHLEDEFEQGRSDDLRSLSCIIKQHFGIDKK